MVALDKSGVAHTTKGMKRKKKKKLEARLSSFCI